LSVSHHNGIRVEWRNRESMSDEEFKECANLFSEHYGIWGMFSGQLAGKRIRLSAAELGRRLAPSGTSALLAYADRQLVGQAFSLQSIIPNQVRVTWVTQLVVHEDWRHRGIATRLLNSIWAFSNDFAWGLVTANPLTVRASEKTTRRRCTPKVIRKHLKALGRVCNDIEYVKGKELCVDEERSKVNTEFHIDHSPIEELKRQYPRKWRLGSLEEGEEWLAFTFGEQRQAAWSREDLESALQNSESILREAYQRMNLDACHGWAQHAPQEVEFVENVVALSMPATVVDFGCGHGRHVLEFAKRGCECHGVDFLRGAIEKARERLDTCSELAVTFSSGDCRSIDLGQQFDLGLCVYDVVGSYADDAENRKLLQNVAKHVREGGFLVLSVMNMELTAAIAKQAGDVYDNPHLLQELEPADIMQKTGNVFDPNHFLIDSESDIVYRKEQFSEDGLPSSELIVRDRRYRREDVLKMCAEIGFEPILCRYVQAGRWEKELHATDVKAKEILFIGRKTS